MDRAKLGRDLGSPIDWSSGESHVLINPRLPRDLKNRVQSANLPQTSGHIWLGSSGTTAVGSITLYSLTKTGFLIAADSVNRHLSVNASDVWLLTLPTFHVGGLSVWARAFLGGQKVVDRSLDVWAAEKFHAWVEEAGVTLVSLVPTQIFDLVKLGRKAPRSLRAIVVGGAALTEALYFKARELGFPVLPSFGATEACSQIATAELRSLEGDAFPELRVLSHIEVKLMDEERLAIRSAALFRIRADITPQGVDILWRAGDWYAMKDLAELSFDEKDPGCIWLTPRGRTGDYVKISGEMVNVLELSQLFFEISGCVDFAIIPAFDNRRGQQIVLVLTLTDYKRAEEWVRKFNSHVVPVAKIENVYFVFELPKSDLKKILIGELKKQLGLS